MDLLAHGFVFEGDRWIEQIRRAETLVRLGSLGSYELLAEIGRGAQGVVYKAIQPGTKRQIAIKRLIGGSLAGADMRARLAREVEAAAALHHPTIVTVYGMEFVDGQPVLAMEWVDGMPADLWSDHTGRDRQGLSRQLSLFQVICAGIAHAHERGVIHRDIKPSNILVNSGGEPRILDFGLAKFTSPDRSASDLTITSGFVGTPAYAAPERLAGMAGLSEIRCDVYSLGVLLYRMLTGRLPRPADIPLAEFLQQRSKDPPKPSAINPALNAELDAIILTALAAESTQRYASVDKLADDVRDYLEGRPISAAASTFTYRLAKTVRRNKAAFATAAVIVLILLAATIVAGALAVQASRARSEADDRTRVAESINSFLVDDLLAAVDPANTDNPNLTMREVLDRASIEIDDRFNSEPLVKASIQHAIGRSYLALGLPAEAVPHFEDAADLRAAQLGPRHADTRQATRDLADALCWGDRHDEALPIASALLELDVEAAGAGSADAMTTRYLVLRAHGEPDFNKRLSELSDILEWHVQHLGAAHPKTLDVTHHLANEYLYNNRAHQAEPLIERMWEAVRSTYGETHPQTLEAMLGRAVLYGRTDRDEQAVEVLQEAVRIYRKTKPDNFPPLGITLGHLGAHLTTLQRYDEAEAAFIEGYEVLSASRGGDVGWAQGIVRMLAGLYDTTGKPEQAALWRERLLPTFEQPPPVQPSPD